MDKPAFEINDMGGKHYRIWADGRVEGFEDIKPCIITNRIPVEIARAVESAAVKIRASAKT